MFDATFPWGILIACFGPTIAVVGIVMPILLHLDKRNHQLIKSIDQEVRGFHERLLETQKKKEKK